MTLSWRTFVLFSISVVDGGAEALAKCGWNKTFFFICRQVVLTSNCNLHSAALTSLVKAARCCIYKSGRIMQLIPLDLGDKSQCAVAAGLFWQPRWLGFLLHFHKMSSGHGSVRCLAVFFTHFCLRSLMLFIKRNSNSAGVKGTLTQGNKTAFPHMNWRHVRYIQFKLHNLPPQPSRTNQLTVSSLWKCLMLFILFRNDSNTFYSFCCHLFQTFIISSQLATSLLAYTGPNIEPSRPSI